MMSSSSAVGISPALLQAITETLSSSNGLTNKASDSSVSSKPVLLKTGQTVFIVRNYADPNNIQQLSNQPAHVLPVSNLSAEGTNRIQLKMEPGQQNEGIVLGRPSGLTFLVSNPTNMSFLNDVENPSDLKNLPEESLALVSSTSNASQNSAVINQFCPVCGDHISGFHYGIYCCESCKGFFKRTVQNNKSFSCRLSADCTVELSNRKKCPACRFEKCKQAGMKVEAIRPDRTRGGRSNYEGKNTTTYHSFTSNVQKKRQNVSARVTSRPSPSNQAKMRTLSSFLTSRVPSILQDLLAIESVMYDLESEEQNCSDAICSVLGCSMELNFDSLLHLADHCLYRIVRWARSNPDFVYIPTDDQILLLQNSWTDLLLLNCCSKSIDHPGRLKVGKRHFLTLASASKLGIEKAVQRLLNFTDDLCSLKIDEYEFAALRVLLLLSPDIENLTNTKLVTAGQEKLMDTLEIYSRTRFPDLWNRFGRMVAKIAELSRTSCIAKDLLVPHQTSGRIPQHSLLYELLRGDTSLH